MIPIAVLLAACSSPENGAESPTTPETTDPGAGAGTGTEVAAAAGSGAEAGAGWEVSGWQTLLDEYATADAHFRYAALRENEEHAALLATLVSSIASADVSSWSRDAQLAFYINAYNVLVIRTVEDRWPIESVMSPDGFFEGVTYTVAGTERTLNALENDVIRGDAFTEPRIHFAVNCASAGCPPLSRTAFTAENLEAQLTAQANAFVRSTSRVERGSSRVSVSQIFEWFAADFERVGGARAFLADHLEGDDAAFVRDDGTTIAHFEYDWAINSQ